MPCSQERDEKLVIFDLDGVLSHRDTMAALVLAQLRAHPWRFVIAAPLFAIAIVSPPKGRIRPRMNRLLVKLGVRGLTGEQYKHLAREVGGVLATRDGFHVKQSIGTVRAAARAVVVTASEKHLAAAYPKGIGLGDVPILASTLTPTARGLILSPHNVGAAKVQALEHHGVDLSGALLYTDSASDLPLARRVERVVLVNPSRRCRRRFEAEMTVDTVRWRSD